MVYHHTKHDKPVCNGSLVTAVKLYTKENDRHAVVLYFTIERLKKAAYFSKICYNTPF